ncbi:putative rho-gdp dissociation inhibitor protein [Neofusicoccum parvum UCRNP2]|uniref:Putative rho-gdp dissociation inhibitor protein n=1 Tax=Botryosphaeria parva (strain UCR-NP2) TaxID=1287680 RepID=R1GF76_BOTPV|nr:putative rho-gdp dissociation inhibitor protein [Neofusicoccum parvum UCRNP2]
MEITMKTTTIQPILLDNKYLISVKSWIRKIHNLREVHHIRKIHNLREVHQNLREVHQIRKIHNLRAISGIRARTNQNDESLRKWKESLGLGAGNTISDPNDPRTVIILSLGLEVEGREDIIIDLSAPGAVDHLKEKPFSIKEGAQFRMKATFKVQHNILSGLKYIQVVKRMGISNKMQEMIGSYSPNTTDKPFYEKKCKDHFVVSVSLIRAYTNPVEPEVAPSGMMARGHYNAVSKFIDDDQQTHLKFEWSFDIKKDW